jgi:hypothetical protein
MKACGVIIILRVETAMAKSFHDLPAWTDRVRPGGNSTCATALEIFFLQIYPAGPERHDRKTHHRGAARPGFAAN